MGCCCKCCKCCHETKIYPLDYLFPEIDTYPLTCELNTAIGTYNAMVKVYNSSITPYIKANEECLVAVGMEDTNANGEQIVRGLLLAICSQTWIHPGDLLKQIHITSKRRPFIIFGTLENFSEVPDTISKLMLTIQDTPESLVELQDYLIVLPRQIIKAEEMFNHDFVAQTDWKKEQCIKEAR